MVIEYKVVSEFDVTTREAKAEVLRRVGKGPWTSVQGLPIASFPKGTYRKDSVAYHEALAIEQIKVQIEADRTATLRLGFPFSINGNRFYVNDAK